jgi:FkbM family methyltransferase
MTLLTRRFIWRAGRRLYMGARKEEPNHITSKGEGRLQELVADRVRLGSRLIIFDVGARVGDWSRGIVDFASRRSEGCEVHAFEPVPESRLALEKSFRSQIESRAMRVSPIGLSNAVGSFPIYVPHFTAGTSTLHPDSSIRYEQVLQVNTTTVDRYCQENSIDHIDLLKVDTEGHDLRVIEGAQQNLKSGRVGVLQFEYNHRWIYSRTYLRDVFELVRDTPYRIAKVCSNALEIYVEWHPELERFFETNFALVHEQLVESLECRVLRIGRGNACETAAIAGAS